MESVLPSNVVFLTDGAMDTEKSKTIEISMSKTRFLAASPSFQAKWRIKMCSRLSYFG